jgi:hypothetical protein
MPPKEQRGKPSRTRAGPTQSLLPSAVSAVPRSR